jgi:hypothetical protein
LRIFDDKSQPKNQQHLDQYVERYLFGGYVREKQIFEDEKYAKKR